MNRRDLIQRVLLGSTALIVMPAAFSNCEKKAEPVPDPEPGTGAGSITIDLSLAANAALNSSGGSKIVQKIILLNSGGTFVALSNVCTHEGCTVAYDSGADNIKCPCHGSVYSNAGSVLTGPAMLALQSYPVAKAGNILTITL